MRSSSSALLDALLGKLVGVCRDLHQNNPVPRVCNRAGRRRKHEAISMMFDECLAKIRRMDSTAGCSSREGLHHKPSTTCKL
jgi:hypothetical protein